MHHFISSNVFGTNASSFNSSRFEQSNPVYSIPFEEVIETAANRLRIDKDMLISKILPTSFIQFLSENPDSLSDSYQKQKWINLIINMSQKSFVGFNPELMNILSAISFTELNVLEQVYQNYLAAKGNLMDEYQSSPEFENLNHQHLYLAPSIFCFEVNEIATLRDVSKQEVHLLLARLVEFGLIQITHHHTNTQATNEIHSYSYQNHFPDFSLTSFGAYFMKCISW